MLTNTVYFQVNPVKNFACSWGILPSDFLNGIKNEPQNIILLNDDYQNANDFNMSTKFDIIAGENEIREYMIDNRTSTKKWVDFKSKEDLDSLSEDEIADLLYLSHMGMPMTGISPFSAKINNQFVFLSDSTGFTKVYLRRFNEINQILAVCLKRHLKEQWNKRRVFVKSIPFKDVDLQTLTKLLKLGITGVIIPCDMVEIEKPKLEIPLIRHQKQSPRVIWNSEAQLRAGTEKVGQITYDISTQTWELRKDVDDEGELNDLV
ncbi:hypothetical protein FRFR103141_05450 [Fructilactobacillus fructivorans]|uniref:hypothetical protein n=1 Tax=Fructilactobacillus fructivorans TaxID=1614 RepID=UPI00070A9211|nr:hypothetical protein [Fructilactobacillus fructivorans]